MEEIKNLFDYATKELSQDAFLRWLLENYNCKNKKIREACYALLNLFGIKYKDGEINSIKTWAQWKRIDVFAEIKTIDGKNIALAIEDKTNSGEHNQLKGYSSDIEKYYKKSKEHWIIKKVFYKTALANENDIVACKKNGWDTFFIKEIFKVFNDEKFDNTNSELLDFYVKHIRKLYKDLTEISKDSMDNWNCNNFYTFFEQKIMNSIELINDENFINIEHWGWYGTYASIGANRKFENDKKHFSLEIVARPYNHKFDVIIRFNNNGDKNNLLVSEKNAIKKYLSQQLDVCNIKLVLRNHKMCIASNSNTNKGKDNSLSYERNLDELENTMIKLFKWFFRISNIDYYDVLTKYGNQDS